MNPLLIIGTIMILTGIVVIYYGHKRSVPNAVLWAIFPIAHGLHEFADYALDEMAAPFFVERLELFFAIGSSLALVGAIFEFTGALSKPIGKILTISTLIFSFYFITILSEQSIEDISEIVINFGVLHSEPFRFFYGFFLILFSVIVLLITYFYQIKNSKLKNITLDSNIKTLTVLASVLLIIFGIFEGFESTNPIFIEFRAISLALFIIIPLLFIIISKPGLQKLLILNESGMLNYGFHFGKKKDIMRDSSMKEELDQAIMASGFLSALTIYSSQISQGTNFFNIRSGGLYFTLSKIGNTLFALQSIAATKQLDTQFSLFIQKISKDLKSEETLTPEQIEALNNSVNLFFKGLF